MQAQSTATATTQQQFVRMLPAIERVGRFYFRHRPDRDECIQEIAAIAWQGFLRCLANGNRRYTAQTLAKYACRQVQVGRCIQRKYGKSIGDLRPECQPVAWVKLTDYFDERANPARIVPFKLDVPTWLASLPAVLRRTADALIQSGPEALGQEIAAQLGISPGRLSQRRRMLLQSWLAFTS